MRYVFFIIAFSFLAGCVFKDPGLERQYGYSPRAGMHVKQSPYTAKPIDWAAVEKATLIPTSEIHVFAPGTSTARSAPGTSKKDHVGYLETVRKPWHDENGKRHVRVTHIVSNRLGKRIGYFTPEGRASKYAYSDKAGFYSKPYGYHTHEEAIRWLLDLDANAILEFHKIDFDWYMSEEFPIPKKLPPTSPEELKGEEEEVRSEE
jgi:hypothetical protein